MNATSRMVDSLLRRHLLRKPLDYKFSSDEKQEVLTWRNTLLRQVKSYIDNTCKCNRSSGKFDRSNQN